MEEEGSEQGRLMKDAHPLAAPANRKGQWQSEPETLTQADEPEKQNNDRVFTTGHEIADTMTPNREIPCLMQETEDSRTYLSFTTSLLGAHELMIGALVSIVAARLVLDLGVIRGAPLLRPQRRLHGMCACLSHSACAGA